MAMRLLHLIAALLLTSTALAQPAKKPPAFFKTPLKLEEMRGKQAVIETAMGQIVIDLLPEAAPNHVGYVIKLAREGAYNGTTFHRLIKYGIIQGGDPLSKDPSAKEKYGTGGLGVLQAELNVEKHTRGAVSAVLRPGQRDSAGAQFFIVITDQAALDGQYTVFGRVAEGITIAQNISEAPADGNGRALERIEITSVTIRDRPPDVPETFSTESVADLASYRAVLETTGGPVTIEFAPDKAPTHVRNFLRLASAGAYDGTAFHRVVRGFVVQTGSMDTRREPLTEAQQKLVRTLAPEFNDIAHVKGTVSMAHGPDPASASTSFFICTAPAPSLDGKYTAFGRVVSGLDVVEKIEATPVDGEKPTTRIDLTRVRVEKK
jgi:cyclophilin family peptidyl-prolyl cis-trans isomerase